MNVSNHFCSVYLNAIYFLGISMDFNNSVRVSITLLGGGTVAQKRLSSLPQKDPTVPKSDLQPEYQLASTVYTGSPFCNLQAMLATSHSESAHSRSCLLVQ